jgi:predicted nucleotidyltransferase
MNLIERNIEMIKRLCKKHKVRELFVFGSILSNNFNENSDVDFVVDFEKVDLNDYADNYFDLKSALEKLLKRPVDLLENQAIRNPFLKQSIDSTKKLVYG